MIRSIVLLLLPTVWLAGATAAQPDRTAALEKAKAKFEKDVAKAEETLLAGIEKSMAQATKAGNKSLQEKLIYDRENFTKSRILPTAYPNDPYLRQRNQAINALQTEYKRAIKDLTEAKKLAEATAIEEALGELVKAARGYGLAFPDLERPSVMFQIENKNSGMIIDVGPTAVVFLTPKTGKLVKSQCWRLEREEKGFLLKNVQSGHWLHVPFGGKAPGSGLNTWQLDRAKDTPQDFLLQMNEVRREIVIESIFTGLILTATEKKEKGVTVTYVTQEKKEETTLPNQFWALIEVK